MRGVSRFGSADRDWAVLRRLHAWLAPDDLRVWGTEGIIAQVGTAEAAERLSSLGVPIVNLAAPIVGLPMRQVRFDDHAVGRLAAEHLAARGYSTLTFAGTPVFMESVRREAGLRETAAKLGCRMVPRFDTNVGGPRLLAITDALRAWVRALPAGSGVLCFNDETASRVAEACVVEGRRVPDDIGIVGVDNDEVVCEAAYPGLSSVELPAERLGHEAARLLDAMLNGAESPTPAPLAPVGLTQRRSTDRHVG